MIANMCEDVLLVLESGSSTSHIYMSCPILRPQVIDSHQLKCKQWLPIASTSRRL